MTQIYNDGTYRENNPTWYEEDSPWKAMQIKRIIEKNFLNPNTICEIGCGAGEVLNQLSKHYDDEKEFFGYEVSPQALELCSTRSKQNLIFKLSNLLDDNTVYFDIAMAIDVFEHVEDYFSFLRKLKTKAKYKIFHTPLDLSVQSVLCSSPILKLRKSVGHIHYFTKETALEALKDAGYEIVDYLYTNSSIGLPKRGWKVNLLKIPRKLFLSVDNDWAIRVFGRLFTSGLGQIAHKDRLQVI